MSVVSPERSDDDYQRFLKEYHNFNDKGKNRTTALSRKFDESQEMHTLSDRLVDGRIIVNDIVTVMKNKKATKTCQNEALKYLEQSIGPLLDIAANLLRKSAHTVAPIAGAGYAHRRTKVSKMKELNIPTKPNPASSLFLIDKFLQQHKPATATPVHGRRSKRTRNGNSIPSIYTTISPRNKEARDNNNEDNADEEDRDNGNEDNAGNNIEEPIVPKPKKGTVYGLGEFIDIITQYKWKSVTRGRMMKSMISHGYVPRSYVTASKFIRAHEQDGKVFAEFDPWPENGRPPILNEDEVNDLALKITNNVGEKFLESGIEEKLIEHMRKKGNLAADGPHRTTTANYKSYLATKNAELQLIGKSNPKTNARWTAEHSDMAAFALMVLIACTHFYVVAEDNADWDQSVEELPYDIKEFYLMMKEIHGGRPIRVVDPSYVINEDCQTQYLTLGRQDDDSNSIGLVSSASLVNSRTRSTYHREDSNKMSGMRVKRHLIMNARGDTAPAVYSFNGLTDAEMPGDQDIIIWAVKGLCIGGYGASSSTEVGYVVFKRGVKGAEKKQFRWMREDVLIPWIRLLRRKYHDVSEDDKVVCVLYFSCCQ